MVERDDFEPSVPIVQSLEARSDIQANTHRGGTSTALAGVQPPNWKVLTCANLINRP
jgi:hypothetical protein